MKRGGERLRIAVSAIGILSFALPALSRADETGDCDQARARLLESAARCSDADAARCRQVVEDQYNQCLQLVVQDRRHPEFAAPPSSTDGSASYWTGQRTAGAMIAVVGLVGLSAASVVGLVAKAQFSSAQGEYGSQRYDDSGSAVGTGNVATALAVAGGVVTAAGLVVWLTGSSAKAAVGVNGPGLIVRGEF